MNYKCFPRSATVHSLTPAVAQDGADDAHPLNIVIVLSSMSYGGAQRVAALLANHWARRGGQVSVITFDSAAEDRFELDRNVRRIALDMTGNAANLLHALEENTSRVVALRRAIIASRADAVLSFGDQTNIVAVLATRLTGIPCVIAERTDPSHHDIGPLWDTLRRLVYPLASALVVQTRSLVPWARSVMLSSRKARVVRNPVRDMHKYVRREQAPAKRVVIAAGRLAPEKAYDVLLMAFSRVTGAFPGWSLLVLGEGPERRALEALAHSLGITDRVSFPGWMSEPGESLSNADLFVICSRYEGFPNALLEAMACGLPVISTDCLGSREIVTHDLNGVLVPVDSPDSLTEAMSKLMADDALRRRLADAALATSAHFSLQSVADEWDCILRPARVTARACRV